jgi:hypothetical protein
MRVLYNYTYPFLSWPPLKRAWSAYVSVVITLNLWILMDSSSVSPARNSEPQLRVQVRIMIAVAIGICRSLLAIRSTLAVLLAHFGTPKMKGWWFHHQKVWISGRVSFHFIQVHSKCWFMIWKNGKMLCMYVCIFRYIDIDTMYVCYMCVFCSMRWWGSTRLYFPPGTCGRPVQRRGAGLQAECALGVSKVWIVSPSGGIKPIMIGI